MTNIIEITTTIGCTNQCVFCPQEALKKAYAQKSRIELLTPALFKQYLTTIPPSVDLHFSGMCEPFLNPKCTQMILYAFDKGHRVQVSTTLIGMKKDDIDQLELIPFKRFNVHLPSNDNSFEKIPVDENYLQLVKKIGRSKITVNFRFLGQAVHPQIKSLLKEKTVEYDEIRTRAGNIRIQGVSSPKKRKGRIACERDFHQNILLPNGDILLCAMDYTMQHILGNLLTQSYDSLFTGEEFIRVRRGSTDESFDILCRYCDMFVSLENS